MKLEAEMQKQYCVASIKHFQVKIAALRKCISMDSPISYIMETNFPGLTGNESVIRELECVMCL